MFTSVAMLWTICGIALLFTANKMAKSKDPYASFAIYGAVMMASGIAMIYLVTSGTIVLPLQ
ncbi:MAG: hypothetical protein Q4A75_07310 [Peptostreptococcaceae bacterium]|nr:hypothetical protein [Peptostreptococcaceae bacterium]